MAGFDHVAAVSPADDNPAALALAAALSAQLQPGRVLGWLRSALDAVDWVLGTVGEGCCTLQHCVVMHARGKCRHCLALPGPPNSQPTSLAPLSPLPEGTEQSTCRNPLLGILAGTSGAVLWLHQALCEEPELLSRLARLFARLHTALAAAPNWEDAIWCENHDNLCVWARSWSDVSLSSEDQQAALLPLLVAAAACSKARRQCWPACQRSLPAQSRQGSWPPAGFRAFV